MSLSSLPPSLHQQIGIVSTMHCKKVRLAVDAAMADHPSPLDGVNHKWVAGRSDLCTMMSFMTFVL